MVVNEAGGAYHVHDSYCTPNSVNMSGFLSSKLGLSENGMHVNTHQLPQSFVVTSNSDEQRIEGGTGTLEYRHGVDEAPAAHGLAMR